MFKQSDPSPAKETNAQRLDRLTYAFREVASKKMDHWDELKSAASDLRSSIDAARGAADRAEGALIRILSALSNNS